jgi:hypothetical protein
MRSIPKIWLSHWTSQYEEISVPEIYTKHWKSETRNMKWEHDTDSERGNITSKGKLGQDEKKDITGHTSGKQQLIAYNK